MLYGAMNFPVRPFLDELEIFSSLGFDYLELAMDPPWGGYGRGDRSGSPGAYATQTDRRTPESVNGGIRLRPSSGRTQRR